MSPTKQFYFFELNPQKPNIATLVNTYKPKYHISLYVYIFGTTRTDAVLTSVLWAGFENLSTHNILRST